VKSTEATSIPESILRSMKPVPIGDAQFRRFGRATDAVSGRIEFASVDATSARQ
jgi:hypothetical protein